MKAALLQLCASDDPVENLSTTVRLIDQAIGRGATFVLTPEVSNCVSTSRDQQRAVLVRERDDITLAAVRTKAADEGVHILIGSLGLATDDARGRFANRSFLIGPDGAIRARYDKIHMFDVQIDESETYRESDGYRPGEQAIVADAGFAKIGMSVCYDLRFPLLANALAKAGAEVLTYPAAFSPVTGAAHWHSLLRARAIETGCWVLAPAQTGHHEAVAGKRRQTFGHSLVVDPWGEVVLDAGQETGVYIFDLDLGKVAEARRRVPALANARVFEAPRAG
ncbi:MAG: carbon-nitrogen hydrolase family protein [Pseudomonadota bacterium]